MLVSASMKSIRQLLRALRSSRQRLKDFELLMQTVLKVDGVPAAVLLANTMTAHRYTGLYCFDQDLIVCRCLWDKTGAVMTQPAALPLHQSFCMHILQSGHGLSVLDALTDPRLAGHPQRAEWRSYCGAPLLDQDGRVAGTFCHFDEAPNRLGPADFEHVHIAAAVLQGPVLGEPLEA